MCQEAVAVASKYDGKAVGRKGYFRLVVRNDATVPYFPEPLVGERHFHALSAEPEPSPVPLSFASPAALSSTSLGAAHPSYNPQLPLVAAMPLPPPPPQQHPAQPNHLFPVSAAVGGECSLLRWSTGSRSMI